MIVGMRSDMLSLWCVLKSSTDAQSRSKRPYEDSLIGILQNPLRYFQVTQVWCALVASRYGWLTTMVCSRITVSCQGLQRETTLQRAHGLWSLLCLDYLNNNRRHHRVFGWRVSRVRAQRHYMDFKCICFAAMSCRRREKKSFPPSVSAQKSAANL